MEIKILRKKIGSKHPAFVIAEGGINHDGNLRIAKKIILKAYESNADAIKFQTFKASDLASPKSNYFKLFKKVELSDSDFEELSDYAKQIGIPFLSTPFSFDAVKLLKRLKIPAFKMNQVAFTVFMI